MAHMKIAPPDICKLNPQVPAALAHILGKMLAKRPKDRYQTPEGPPRTSTTLKNSHLVQSEDRPASLEDLARAETDRSASTARSRPGRG